jgi:predicted nucleic acid-binding protein
MEGIVIDTNVFVAARSASARVLEAVRTERFHLIWNQSTRREIEMILRTPVFGARSLI